MQTIQEVLADTAHRPWALLHEKWQYYQEWNNVIFLHFEVPFDTLQKLVPEQLKLDNFNGKYYVSIVPFSMQNIRPRNLPAVKFVSDFHEINLRTYIEINGKKGVYFLNIEAEKSISVFVSNILSGLPYEKANIKRSEGKYESENAQKPFSFQTEFSAKEFVHEKTKLEKWLTERYSLYLDKSNKIYRYEIHHSEWKIQKIEFRKLKFNYQKGEILLTEKTPFFAHFSKGVQVLSWKKELLKL